MFDNFDWGSDFSECCRRADVDTNRGNRRRPSQHDMLRPVITENLDPAVEITELLPSAPKSLPSTRVQPLDMLDARGRVSESCFSSTVRGQ
jgi:hypothetical protein